MRPRFLYLRLMLAVLLGCTALGIGEGMALSHRPLGVLWMLVPLALLALVLVWSAYENNRMSR